MEASKQPTGRNGKEGKQSLSKYFDRTMDIFVFDFLSFSVEGLFAMPTNLKNGNA